MEDEKELKRVQTLSQSYYSRKEIQNAIFDFCKNRETVPRYLEGFGKRPDCLDYPNDIFNYSKNGATSFHCSEELWQNPLDIKTEMSKEDYNKIRIGWDFLIDIDSKYFDYSKIAAKLLIQALEHHGINNIGIKFSGNKGFHIIIPFKSFPKEVNGKKTKDMFPEWPRLIADYLTDLIHDQITEEILNLSNETDIESKGNSIYQILCKRCGKKIIEKQIGKYVCPNLKCRSVVNSMKSNRKQMVCPSCNSKMNRVEMQKVYFCENCNLNSQKNPELFEKKATAKELIDVVDIILVSPRHLFRVPYSLHEKTALSSIVLKKEDLPNFKPVDADPLKIKEINNFIPDSQENEARYLLYQALDKAEIKEVKTEKKNFSNNSSIDIKGLKITEDMFPQVIKNILKGIEKDGRKRALYILLSFFFSLGFSKEYVQSKIYEWNEKNYNKLPQNYIDSQVSWFEKKKPMPPNYDKPIYQEFGVIPESGIKNPINYTIKEALKQNSRKKNKKTIIQAI